MVLQAMIVVPLGLYVESQFKVVSDVMSTASFQYLAIMLRNKSLALLFFQWVFLSASSRMFILLGLLLINNSVRR